MKTETITVAKLGRIVTGKTPPTKDKDNYGGTIPFITPVDMTGNRSIIKTERYVTAKGLGTVRNCYLPEHSVCVSCIGSDMGKAVLTTAPSITNQQINSIVVDEDSYDYMYVYYLMRTLEEKIKSLGKNATAVPILNKTKFSNIEIQVPEIDVQRSISNILSAYDNLIENNEKQIKLLEEAAQRWYKEWFVDLRFPGYESTPIVDGVPEGWKKDRLIDIADVQYGYAFDGSLFNSQRRGIPIVRIRNIPSGFTDDYTTEEANDMFLVQNSDIIVGMDGEFHINSWCGDSAYLVQRTCRIRPKDVSMKGWLLQAIYEPIKLFEKTVVGATVAHLGKKHIDTIMLLTSPNRYYKPFSDLFEKRQTLLNQNRKLSQTRDLLLPKLMNGELEA